MGYLVCNKCGEYYEFPEGEVPEDFSDKCDCGGTLEYFDNSGKLKRKKAEKKIQKLFGDYSSIPSMLVIFSLFLFIAMYYNLPIIVTLGIVGLIFGLTFYLVNKIGIWKKLNVKIKQLIYFTSAILFFIESGAIIILWFNFEYFSRGKVLAPIMVLLGVICGIIMIMKTLNLDDPPKNVEDN